MKGLYSLLQESRYPSVDILISSIFDRIDNELIDIQGNLESGDYTNEEISEQIGALRKQIVRD